MAATIVVDIRRSRAAALGGLASGSGANQSAIRTFLRLAVAGGRWHLNQNRDVEVLRVRLQEQGAVEVGVVGPKGGPAVLYFHSPATAGEEVSAAASAAEHLNLRLISLRRPSIRFHHGDDFVNIVAEHSEALIEALGLDRLPIVGWSGGSPYALAASVRLGRRVSAVHLVSPVPGPLRGPSALPNQTERLREVAATTVASRWVTGRATLRDYQALASPWNFDMGMITQPVTIWAPTDDEVVPLHLIEHLAHSLPSVDVIEVAGGHDWLMDNWSAVLARTRA